MHHNSYMTLVWRAAFAIATLMGCRATAATDGPIGLTPAAPEIRVGMSTVLSGPAADLGRDMRAGVQAGFDRVNRAGGVRGRTLRLITLDDGYEPARTAPNMHQLIDRDNVLAVIGNVGTPTAIAAMPIAIENKTLFFAPFTGAGVLRKSPPDRYVINYRASYAEETAAMIDALVHTGNVDPRDIAIFSQRDSYGDAGFDGAIAALKRHGLTSAGAITHVRYERNTLNVEDALATLLYAEREPRAVIMVGSYRPCAKFIKLAKAAGVKSLFLNLSFVGGESLAEEIGDVPADVIVTQVVPSPLDTRLRIVRDFRDDLEASDPKATPKLGSLEGYIAARIFAAGLARTTGEPTRQSVIDGLESLGEFDLGLETPLGFSATEHQASHHVWPTVLRQGRLVPFDWKDIAALLPTEAR